MTLSCEQTELHKSGTNGHRQIEFRGDCDLCPGEEECCCQVWLFHDDLAHLEICGTSDGIDACSGDDVCGSGSISGGGKTFDLDEMVNPEEPFCMLEGKGFWIRNTSSTDDADIKLSCQSDWTNPQILTIHLDPLDKFYYETNGSCILTLCP